MTSAPISAINLAAYGADTSAPTSIILSPAKAPDIYKPRAEAITAAGRQGKVVLWPVGTSLERFEIVFRRAAVRTQPAGGNVFETGAGRDSMVRHAGSFVIYEAAGDTDPFLHA